VVVPCWPLRDARCFIRSCIAGGINLGDDVIEDGDNTDVVVVAAVVDVPLAEPVLPKLLCEDDRYCLAIDGRCVVDGDDDDDVAAAFGGLEEREDVVSPGEVVVFAVVAALVSLQPPPPPPRSSRPSSVVMAQRLLIVDCCLLLLYIGC
jgi:hypothetical protein